MNRTRGARCSLLGAARSAELPSLSAKLLCQKKLPVDTQPPVQKGGVHKTVKE